MLVLSPTNLYSHFVSSSSRIQVRNPTHRRREFLMFMDFWNSSGVGILWGWYRRGRRATLWGGGQLLGGRVFPDPKINSLGGGYYHDNEITYFKIHQNSTNVEFGAVQKLESQLEKSLENHLGNPDEKLCKRWKHKQKTRRYTSAKVRNCRRF